MCVYIYIYIYVKELFAAMNPRIPDNKLEALVSQLYSVNNLHPNARVTVENFMEFVADEGYELVPVRSPRRSSMTKSINSASGSPASSRKTSPLASRSTTMLSGNRSRAPTNV